MLGGPIMTHSAGPCCENMSCRGYDLHKHIDSFKKKKKH